MEVHHSPLNADGYAITFGVQLSIIGTSRARSSIANRWQRLAVWITAGWALTLAQALPLLPNPSASTVLLLAITTFAGIFIGTLSFDFQRPRLYAVDSSDLAIHSTGFACALFASLTTVGLLSMIER